jgi:hypothetical protein
VEDDARGDRRRLRAHRHGIAQKRSGASRLRALLPHVRGAGATRAQPFWRRAAAGGAVDWDELLAPYRAAVDWPACRFYRELAAFYPDAKVILTLRDPAAWFASAWSTIFPRITRQVAPDDEQAWLRAKMQRQIIIEQTFGGDIETRDHVLAVFERHCTAVRRAIPRVRLLEYHVAAGWGPLCDFLACPVPDAPFPHPNAAEDFRTRFLGAR